MLSLSKNSFLRGIAIVSAVLAIGSVRSHSQEAGTAHVDKVGDTYKVRLERESKRNGSASSGGSTSRTTLTERVVELRADGIVLEFDLPADTSAKERAREWQFPARVLKRPDGSLELVNLDELEARSVAWLERAELDPSACGKWLFTWTAVKIECDPQSAIDLIQPFDLRQSNLVEGAMYQETGADGPSRIEMMRQESGGAIFTAKTEVDPDFMRRQRAEADLVVAEIMGDTVPTLDAAIQMRSLDRYSGSIVTEFETDAAGRVVRKTTVTEVMAEFPDRTVEHETTTQIVRREMVP